MAATLLALSPAAAQTIQVPVTADNSIIDVKGERDLNMGKASSLRIKSFQHHLILKLDTTALQGKTVTSARLRYTPLKFTLNRVSVSTIQGDWGEGDSGGFAKSVGGSTYDSGFHANDGGTPWAWPGSHFPDVVYGNAFSLQTESTSLVVDGRYDWIVPPDLVHANAVGAAYGLAVFESEHDVSRNPTVASVENAGAAPYLEVILGPAEAAPDDFGAVEVVDADTEPGEVVLELAAPSGAFAYRITVDGVELPRYQIPFAAAAGVSQRVRIRDVLTPGQSAEVLLLAVSRSGATNTPKTVQVTGASPAPLPYPEAGLPEVDPGGSGVIEAGDLRVWAAPETDKIRPDGAFLETVPAEYRGANGRFGGKRIRLRAARRETVAFVLVLEAVDQPVTNLTVAVEAPDGVAARVQALRSITTGDGPLPEVLVGPEGTTLGASLGDLATNGDTGAPGAKVQQVLIELEIPAGYTAGKYEGQVQISGGATATVPLDLWVRDFSLPAATTFLLELNTYSYPNYYATFGAIQRLVRRFRCHVNVVPYAHSGRTRMDMIKPDGSSMDEDGYNDFKAGDKTGNWAPDFTWAFGPFFTGEAFDGPPLRQFYLTFHENWPLPMKAFHAAGNMDAFTTFDPSYGQTWTDVLTDFAKLAADSGWSGTGFQVYLNNKPGPNNPTPWSLDEPASLWDFRALNYYSTLFDEAALGAGVDIRFRVDISRPEYHRGHLDRVDLYVCNAGVCGGFARTVADQREKLGFEYWTYGSANAVTASNHHIQAWAAITFGQGGNGVLPWQTLGKGASFLAGADDGAQRLAMVVVAEDAQAPEVWGTLRLAAYRRAQQDMEYLRLMQAAGGYSEGQMARLIGHYLDPDGDVPSAGHYADYAAALPWTGHSEAAFDGLREHAAAAVEALGAPDDTTDTGDPTGTDDTTDTSDTTDTTEDTTQTTEDTTDTTEDTTDTTDSAAPCDPATRGPSAAGEACTKTADCQCPLACTPQGAFLLCAAPAEPPAIAPAEDDSGCTASSRPTGGHVPATVLLATSLLMICCHRRRVSPDGLIRDQGP